MCHSNYSQIAKSLLALLAVVMLAPTTRAQDGPTLPNPSPEHELLKKDVGNWDATIKFWEKPGGEAGESKGEESNELLPGGMWLVSKFQADFGGQKFYGRAAFGYDPADKKYVGTWIDSTSPYLLITKADYNPATRTLTGIGEGRDLKTGKPMKSRSITRYVDDTTRVFEMYTPGEDGKDWKIMEITYKRRPQ